MRALESDKGIEVACGSHDAAFHLRMRLYAARKAAQREAKRLYPKEDMRHGKTPYDHFIMKVEDTTLRIIKGEALTYAIKEL